MKKALLILSLFTGASLSCAAQTRSYGSDEGRVRTRQDVTCPKVYLGFSTGINNPSSLLGLNVDVAVHPQVTVGAGFGLLSTWGAKVALEGRYYFDECHRGWALGGGLTSNSGIRNLTMDLETKQFGTTLTPVTLDLHRKTNIFFSGYRFFKVGRTSRFHIQLGYSYGLHNARYTVKSNVTLTDNSDAIVRVLAPGGVVLGLGFSFGIGK
jgi:hypothetical protein